MTKYSKAIRSVIDRSPATNIEAIRLNAMLERIHAMTEALENLAAKRDPALPLEAHTLKVAKATEKLKDKIAKTSHEFDELRSQALKGLYGQIDEQANMVVNPTYQQPILNRFIAMKPKEQINFLNELLAEKDGPSLAAILDAPKAATGLAKDHANRMWEAYTKAAAPEATAALSEYNNIQDAVQASMRTASRAADDLNDPREIQRIVAEQDRAREAEQKLNQALE